MGFEPMIRVLQTLALATWPRRLALGILSKSRGMVKQNDSRWPEWSLAGLFYRQTVGVQQLAERFFMVDGFDRVRKEGGYRLDLYF